MTATATRAAIPTILRPTSAPRYEWGLDGDGVVLDGQRHKQLIAKELFDVDIPSHLLSRDKILQSGRLTQEQYHQVKATGYNIREYALRFQFVEGAVERLRRLQETDSAIVITRRSNDAAEHMRLLFERNGLGNIRIIGNGPSKDKEDVIRRIGGVKRYVDDDLDILLRLRGKVEDLILLSWDYNRDDVVPENEGIRRVESWRDLL